MIAAIIVTAIGVIILVGLFYVAHRSPKSEDVDHVGRRIDAYLHPEEWPDSPPPLVVANPDASAVEALKAYLAEVQRYQIVLTDWGPDFTGEDGTLPRWRWVVSDADYEFRKVLGVASADQMLAQGTLMLGNAPTQTLAMWAALAWVDEHKHPLKEVKVVVE